ncbi:NAD(P)-dependent dehydrogenase (short-subunit alcohol dehydrogenase family) [Prauserella isguenensis]|uniref:NAD(P)-dependent dehydrogenase (Short-subunit alcohol dehydrogenase family) n=1 Tax=Prauserella isguenensis TaxID=1470180 RepID=A0A839S5R9_9PSEU|nr:SDR family NAD(P)-dependent oxidoreductase [Prauserella isguenensis]MBB3053185.1 NAD(P)-dependent dehydrogenase (short-subunit alcohol dehydrogenase family) [Prauserella isguenensis]
MSEPGGASSTATTVLITGANKGLGYETARRLGELGWRVFLGARDAIRGRGAAERLVAGGADVTFVPLDVTSDDSVAAAVQAVGEDTDHLDVLINNAGVTGELIGPEETLPQHLIPVFRVNVLGPVRVTHAFLPLLRAGHDPRVVMVSSSAGSQKVTADGERKGGFPQLMYPGSKAALNMITTQYARGIPDIRFNMADPGFTATDLNHNQGTQTVTEGTDAIVEFAATSPGPTGKYRDREGVVPW